jgi:hypothetical protein
MLMRTESDDDRRTDEQAAKKLKALRDEGRGAEDVARSDVSVKNGNLYDANAQNEDASKNEAGEVVRSREEAISRQIFEIFAMLSLVVCRRRCFSIGTIAGL